MCERSSGESSSPLATVEQIQRRLVRPSVPSPTIRSRTPFNEDIKFHDHSSQILEHLNEIQRKGEMKGRETTRKLEDYLDPVLLSVICSKLNGKREEGQSTGKVKSFEWPTEELKVFFEEKRTEKRSVWKDRGAVNLSDDELEREVDNEEEEDACSAFRRFEETLLKLFKN